MMPNISDCLIIGYDQSNDLDMSCLSVAKRISKDRMVILNTFFGKEAEELYERLTKERPAQVIEV